MELTMQYHIRWAYDFAVFDENIRPHSVHKNRIDALFEIYKLDNNLYEPLSYERTKPMLPTRLTPICACFVCNDQALFELEFRTGSKYVCAACGTLYSMLFERDQWRETIFTDLLLIAEQFTKTVIQTAKLVPETLRPDIAEIDKPDITFEDATEYIWRFAASVSCRQKPLLTQSGIYEETYSTQRSASQTGSASAKRSIAPSTSVGKKKSQADINAAMAALFDKEF